MKRWVEKTLAYLESDRGRANWKANEGRGFGYQMNMCASVQTATRLIVYERITEVTEAVEKRLAARVAA